MINWGRVALGTVLPFMFTTYDGATGASEEGSGLAVTDIEIYKAGGGLTQRSSDNGYALLDADGHALDSIVGLAGFSVDTGDNSDAGFFVAGGYYIVVVSSVTVDAQTVNFIAGTFSLGPALSVAGVEEVDVTHWNGTAIATPDTAGYPKVTIKDGTGTGEINTNGGKVVGVELVDTLTTYTGDTPQTGDAYARLGAPAGASVSADIADVEGKVDDLESRLGTPSDLGSGATVAANLADIEAQTDDIGAAGAGLTSIPNSAGVTTLLTRIPNGLFTGITSLAEWLGLIAGKQTGNSTARTEIRATGAGSGTYDETTDSQEAIRDNMGTAQTGDSFARLGAPVGASISADLQVIDGNVDDIETDTNEIQGKLPTNKIMGSSTAADKDDEIDAIKAKTDQFTFTVSNQVDANAITVDEDEILDDQLADSVPADGTLPTVRQALYMLVQFMTERSVSGTTMTIKKVDGTTSLFTLTLDDADNPTSVSRAS